jgi:rubrerythrin
MYKELASQLRSRLKSAKKDLQDLQDDLIDIEQTHRGELREIKQLTMTDEEKWFSDRKEAYYQFNRALETGDEEHYKTARSLAKGLAREVKDAHGEVIRTITDTQSEAMAFVRTIQLAQTDALRQSISTQKAVVNSLNKELETIVVKLTAIQDDIRKLNSTELILEMDETLADLESARGITSQFLADWKALKSKTITMTVKYKYVNAPPSEKKNVEAEAEDVAERIETERWGGLIRRKIGGAVRKAFDIGGKLRGYGGGDKVKALLEPGEYVVRKEAVKKYGENVFSALNNMKVASADVGETVANKIGGIIRRATYQPQAAQAFAGGGAVASASTSEASRIINVYLQPKFLTGDRRSMRVAAVEIQKALTDLDSRWGKR